MFYAEHSLQVKGLSRLLLLTSQLEEQKGKRWSVKENLSRKWHSPDTQSFRISTLLPVPRHQLCFCLFVFQSDLVLLSVSVTSQVQGDGSFSPSLSLSGSLTEDLLNCQFSKFKPFQSLCCKNHRCQLLIEVKQCRNEVSCICCITNPTSTLDRGQDRPDIESLL